MYMRLSTDTLRSSGNCCRHFSKKAAIVSPFVHCRHWYVSSSVQTRSRRGPHSDDLAVSVAVPVAVGDLDVFLLHILLHLQPLAPEGLALVALVLLALAVGQEVGVHGGVLAELGLLRGPVCTVE